MASPCLVPPRVQCENIKVEWWYIRQEPLPEALPEAPYEQLHELPDGFTPPVLLL